jgi:hypothetical protein
MKRKIILSLLSLFLFSAAGAITATFYIRNTTETLARLIKLHQIEDFRQDLIISIQTVQSELYTIGTVFAHDPNVITDNVLRLERGASACSACHVIILPMSLPVSVLSRRILSVTKKRSASI